ncbi:MAG TPA: SRPBCC family protein [Thermoleophilaceae bacterium]|nr:SRPBCC family protein [Thermoleophilaceae bacterium]
MDPVTVHAHICAPRSHVYALIADVAARPMWSDHFAKDYRLVSPRSVGVGAGARFRLDPPGGTRYVEFTVVEARPPRLVVDDGRTGRLGRTRWTARYELTEPAHGVTRVDLTISTHPENPIERLREAIGFQRFVRRGSGQALERLRRILDEGGEEAGARATVAGYEPRKAPRFGVPSGRRFGGDLEGGALPAQRPGPGRVGE